MSDTKFTPGPWAWRGKPGRAQLASAHDTVIDYAGYEGMWFAAYDEEADAANAALIAAAPTLYAALDGLLDRCIKELADPQDVEEVANALAALAAARGEPA
jgi:hypothetical protein